MGSKSERLNLPNINTKITKNSIAKLIASPPVLHKELKCQHSTITIKRLNILKTQQFFLDP